MLSILCVAAVLHAAPHTPIAVGTSTRPGAEASMKALTEHLLVALRVSGVKIDLDPTQTKAKLGKTPCANTACRLTQTEKLGPNALQVFLEVGRASKFLALHVEVLEAGQAGATHVANLTAPADDWSEPVDKLFGEVAAKVVALQKPATPAPPEKVEPTKPVEPPTTPVSLVPAPVEPPKQPPAPAPTPAARPVSALPVGLTIGAGVIGATALVFTVLGLGNRATYEKSAFVRPDGSPATLLPGSQALELQSLTNTQFSIALGLGLGAAVVGAIAAWLFTQS